MKEPVKCQHCGEMHVEGSPDWRDCQDKLFMEMASTPDRWRFAPSPEQVEKVREAHVRAVAEFERVPDIDVLRKLICQSFVVMEDGKVLGNDMGSMTKFWKDFADDMPPVFRRRGDFTELEQVWADRKLEWILQDLKLAYASWEDQEVTADIRAPEMLQGAAVQLTQLDQDGYSLYHYELEESVMHWFFRRQKTNLSSV